MANNFRGYFLPHTVGDGTSYLKLKIFTGCTVCVCVCEKFIINYLNRGDEKRKKYASLAVIIHAACTIVCMPIRATY